MERSDQAGDGKREDTATERDALSGRRDVESALRDGAADARDSVAADRDQTARQRDRAADDRNAEAARLRAIDSTAESASEAFVRRHATADREWSSAGRDAAETEREQSSGDRDISAADRLVSARERASAAMDGLTGSYLRGPGMAELEREMDRAARTRSSLVIAFIDVDALKVVNDTHGHGAGDRLLQAVVRVLAEQLRPYDRIVRYGGDEFVCALTNMTEGEAHVRFTSINAALLSAEADRGSISFGLSTLVAGDSVDALIARADRDLYRKRALR